MNDYIIESMALVGCGVSDTKEIAEIVKGLSEIEHDTLDAMYNFGHHTTLTPVGSSTRAKLMSEYDDDDITCLSTYVNAYRNTN